MSNELPEAKRHSVVMLSQGALPQALLNIWMKATELNWNGGTSGSFVSVDLKRVLQMKPLDHPVLKNNFFSQLDLTAYSADFNEAVDAKAAYNRLIRNSELKNVLVLEPIPIFEG